jgi:hypothetical protein
MKKESLFIGALAFLGAVSALSLFSGCALPANGRLGIDFPAPGTVVREPLFTASGTLGDNSSAAVWVEKDGVVVCNGQKIEISDGKWSADFNMLLNPYDDYRICVRGSGSGRAIGSRAASSEDTVTSDIETNFDSQVIVLTGTTIDAGALYRDLTSQEIIVLRGRQPNRYFYGSDFLLIPANIYDLNLPAGLPEDYYMVYDDLSFRIHGTKVEEITILKDSYSLVNGLTVGSTFDEVKNLFGTGYALTEFPGCNRYFVSYDELGVMFEILYADNTVSELNVLQVQY